MAKCPKCNRKLHIWNVKAECPDCGVNIANYDWENRLEQDAIEAEIAFAKCENPAAALADLFVFQVVANAGCVKAQHHGNGVCSEGEQTAEQLLYAAADSASFREDETDGDERR